MIKTGYSSDEYKKVYSSSTVHVDLEDSVTCIFSNTGGRPATAKDLASIYPFDVENRSYMPKSTETTVTTTIITNPLIERPHLAAQVGLDNMIKYKEHYIVDLQSYDVAKLPENHRRNIRKNDKNKGLDLPFVTVEICANPVLWHNRVSDMYDNLVERHDIKEGSWTAYSREQIKMLLEVPGSVLFRVLHYNNIFHLPDVVNYSLFYIDGPNVYYQLSSMSSKGYKANANFIMMHEAITFFKGLGFDKLLLGAVPDGGSDGLLRFKKGFSTSSSWNYIIKHVNNQPLYDKLCEGKEDNGFFPLYRSK